MKTSFFVYFRYIFAIFLQISFVPHLTSACPVVPSSRTANWSALLLTFLLMIRLRGMVSLSKICWTRQRKIGMAHRPFPTGHKCRERPVCRSLWLCIISERHAGRSLRFFVHHDPFGRIIFNILPNLVVILLIANDMIIIGFLPQFAVKRR